MEAFQANKKVSFGDVNLAESQVRSQKGAGSPGAGGWPTVRYFNKETGYEGAPYEKLTSKAMCDELGSDEYMQGFVMRAGATSLCSVEDGEGCSDKERTYIEKWKSKSATDVSSQIARLQGMVNGHMTTDLKKWINQRLAILEQFKPASSASGEL